MPGLMTGVSKKGFSKIRLGFFVVGVSSDGVSFLDECLYLVG